MLYPIDMSYFLNGSYFFNEEAKISVLDLGLLRGLGVFDYLRTYQGKPFHCLDHLQRLEYSARETGLSLPYSLEELSQTVDTLLEAEQKKHGMECGIKIIITGGVSPSQFMPHHTATCIAFALPHTPYPRHYYTEGVKVISTPHRRHLPHCKTTHYLPAITALQKGAASGAVEALYLSAQGEILEATTSNFFAIKKGKLYTSASPEILLGVTRAIVLKIAENQIPSRFDPIYLDDLPSFEEAFLTATNKEILPVISVDGKVIGNGQVGPYTQQLMEQFQCYTKLPKWPPLQIHPPFSPSSV